MDYRLAILVHTELFLMYLGGFTLRTVGNPRKGSTEDVVFSIMFILVRIFFQCTLSNTDLMCCADRAKRRVRLLVQSRAIRQSLVREDVQQSSNPQSSLSLRCQVRCGHPHAPGIEGEGASGGQVCFLS
jgi:hypothetical protein